MGRRSKAKPVSLTTGEAQALIARFGAVRMRETSEANWGRPDPDQPGGSCNIVISRDRNPLGKGVLSSILRQAKIDPAEFWEAARNRTFPPPARTTRDGLGLSDLELAAAVRGKPGDVAGWCRGERGPSGAQTRRLAALEALRTGSMRGTARWPIWKWLRANHPNLQGMAPVEILGTLDDLGALKGLDDKPGRVPPPEVARALA